ncbi:MAG TPA: phenylacetate-CoA oxygenase/reductase subunit PaaK [Cryomorphaceae bacterium]|nr:phenylacetate-CoA oxygenase/reductase subunit PaaK [Cryomorphaceae bacterium]
MFNFFKKNSTEPSSLQRETNQKSDGRFHAVTVKEVRRETEDAVSIALNLPEDGADFSFSPGQYLTLKADIGGEEVRRSYSVCVAPHEGELRVAVKEIEGGKFSTYANRELKAGDTIESMAPTGNFTWAPTSTASHVAGWAAGSGITPVVSIAKSVLASDDTSTFTLFYGNKNSNSIIFKDAIDDLKNTYLERFEVHHVLSREDQGTDHLKGRIDAVKAEKFAQSLIDLDKVTAHYLCGPQEMIETVSAKLESMGTAKSNIHFELFNTSAPSKDAQVASEERSSTKASVTVVLDGEETHFEMGSKDYVLDAALDAGADVPYACKGAVCCTCRAKVLEGSAEMAMNYALVDDEVKDGYILTCQSYATSDRLVVSFDE